MAVDAVDNVQRLSASDFAQHRGDNHHTAEADWIKMGMQGTR
jgi:hypothetical protein